MRNAVARHPERPAEDYEVIPARDALRRKALVLGGTIEEGLSRAVARAEAAIETLSPDFDRWMADETERVSRAHRAFRAAPGNADARLAFFRAAHDLRGQAASFDYPLAGRICQSLARMLSACPSPPLALVDRHVEALRAVVREGARGAGNPVGAALAEELEWLGEQVVARCGETGGRRV